MWEEENQTRGGGGSGGRRPIWLAHHRHQRRRNLGLSLSKHASPPKKAAGSRKQTRNKSGKHPVGAVLNYSGPRPRAASQEAEMDPWLTSAGAT